jgi:serine/threonine-protein kinase HipA
MASGKTDIYVYAHWKPMAEPRLIGVLSAHAAKGRKAFSFEYSKDWINSKQRMLLDPDIQFYSGSQFPNNKENFGIFLDSMPDTWGRTLMKRRAARKATEKGEKAKTLYEIDYLLGVQDESCMGALLFKTDPDGPFLDNNDHSQTPPWSSVRELQEAAKNIENETDNDAVKKWLAILSVPGSSLGGARPKANIIDEHKNLWIAKFPAKNDTTDKAAWEYLVCQLALRSGISISECKIQKIAGNYHTFFTKRFDREKEQRLHFASAMTMTGNTEDTIRDNPASYLELAEFIQNTCLTLFSFRYSFFEHYC